MYHEQGIYLGDTTVGLAKCEVQGLYHTITCNCRLQAGMIYRIEIRYADRTVPLGICVPNGDGFYLKKRIASKQLGNGTGKLCVVVNSGQNLIPLDPLSPVDYLSELSTARLELRDGSAYIQLQKA